MALLVEILWYISKVGSLPILSLMFIREFIMSILTLVEKG